MPSLALANTALLTTLMSHGMLLLIALVYLLSGTALAVVAKDDPVAQPQGPCDRPHSGASHLRARTTRHQDPISRVPDVSGRRLPGCTGGAWRTEMLMSQGCMCVPLGSTAVAPGG